MPPEIIPCEQNSEEWIKARMGIPTASQFSTVLAKGRGGAPSKTRATYMKKLAGEILTDMPMENYSNAYMERGHAMEEHARDAYEFYADEDTEPVGFIRNDRMGCSPDALVGDKGMVEIKTQAPHLLVDTIMKDEVPGEHVAQCQGQLLVAEREWVDLVIFWPGMPFFCKRVTRDVKYIADLRKQIESFNAELDEIVSTIRAYEQKAAA